MASSDSAVEAGLSHDPHAGQPDPDAYALIDAGEGRRLERFGQVLVDRPAPAVDGLPKRSPAAWSAAAARYDRSPDASRDARAGPAAWHVRSGVPRTWTMTIGDCTIELRLAAGGQVGLFPEHLPAVGRLTAPMPPGPSTGVLHLFAYTGVSTLLLARGGLPVTHVDASNTAIGWARRNADLSGLGAAPIRWIVDDAEAFAAREIRRGRRYAAILMDPPSYGHGAKGRTWRFEDHIAQLVETVCGLLAPGGVLLLTTHTQGFSGERLGAIIRAMAPAPATEIDHGALDLEAETGVRLPLGAWARAIMR